MKKITRKSISIALAATLFLSFAGCEKKAETVEGLGGETETAVIDSSDSESTEAAGGAANAEELTSGTEEGSAGAKSEKWEEIIEPDDMLFKKITILAYLNEFTGQNKVITAEAANFDSAYTEELCGKIFDGDVEVYDYNAKTKKLYDQEIKLYNQIKEMYLDEDSGMIIVQYPDEDEDNEPYMLDAFDDWIDKMDTYISDLEAEKEAAPETIENDFSYGGYVGNISGEEYYMYLGNRNYEEYYQSPISYDYNGRIATVFRTEVSQLFDGNEGIITRYSPTGGTGEYADPPEEILNMADEFVDEIGFSDYQRNGLNGGFAYQKGVDNSVLTTLGLPTSEYSADSLIGDGYVIMYTMAGETYSYIDQWTLQMDVYLDDEDAFDHYSYLAVFVNENGVLGAQIVNPLTVKNVEEVDSIISINDIKDVIIDYATDEDAWNYTVSPPLYPEFDTLDLISFPIRSTEDGHEYTFVPTYILYNSEGGAYGTDTYFTSEKLYYTPFMLINALDGSYIHARHQLADHPTGYMNGNVGFSAFDSGVWKRQEKLYEASGIIVEYIETGEGEDEEE